MSERLTGAEVEDVVWDYESASDQECTCLDLLCEEIDNNHRERWGIE